MINKVTYKCVIRTVLNSSVTLYHNNPAVKKSVSPPLSLSVRS